jgi:archaellum component FlaF (FlaF/FlaG flagellin family)
MKKLLPALFVLVLGSVAFAQSPFDGVWRLNLQNTQYVGKEHYSLDKGIFQCTTCDPKVETKADGQDHPVSGSPYYDMVNVRMVDDRTVEIVNKKSGKVTATVRLTATPDGKALNTESTSVAENGQNVTAKYSSTRVGAAPGSAHKISGEWQPGKLESASENIMEVTYKTTGDRLSMSDRAGNSYTAGFDGKDYLYKGDPGVTAVSLRKVDPNTVEETYKRDGKVVAINRLSVATSGKTMSVSFHDMIRDVTMKWTADKR